MWVPSAELNSTPFSPATHMCLEPVPLPQVTTQEGTRGQASLGSSRLPLAPSCGGPRAPGGLSLTDS